MLHVKSEKDNQVIETAIGLINGLYAITINPIQTSPEVHHTSFLNNDEPLLNLWHAQLGHPGDTMFRRILPATRDTPIPRGKLTRQFSTRPCVPCAQGKLITRPFISKEPITPSAFLEHLYADICGPIYPSSGPFRYFLVLGDASSCWSYVALLSTRDHSFPRIVGKIIQLRTQYPEYTICRIRVDNATEFMSMLFQKFLISIGIQLEFLTPYIHSQNPAESLVKRVQLIARPILLASNLPASAWGHAVLHANNLLRYRPSSYMKETPYELLNGSAPSISHLRTFGCAVYVPVPPPNLTKMGPHCRLGIYIGFDSSSKVCYLDPTMGSLYFARFEDCIFDESIFPILSGQELSEHRKNEKENIFEWPKDLPKHKDIIDGSAKRESEELLKMRNTVVNAPDAFADTSRVTKVSGILQKDAPASVNVGEPPANILSTSKKRGRPFGAKDQQPQKCRTKTEAAIEKRQNEIETESKQDDQPILQDDLEIQTHFTEALTYHIAANIINDNPDPLTVYEAQKRSDWPKWEEAIKAELESLWKRDVFGEVLDTPEGVIPVGCHWVFIRKRNKKGEVTRYKARLVAQGFTQRYGLDYEGTYSPVMDATTFRLLLGISSQLGLEMRLMDVVTAYLYGHLDKAVYMKIPDGVFEQEKRGFRNPSVKLQWALYGLKQAGRIWYQRLASFLIKKGL